jgi:hypothetical protein
MEEKKKRSAWSSGALVCGLVSVLLEFWFFVFSPVLFFRPGKVDVGAVLVMAGTALGLCAIVSTFLAREHREQRWLRGLAGGVLGLIGLVVGGRQLLPWIWG